MAVRRQSVEHEEASGWRAEELRRRTGVLKEADDLDLELPAPRDAAGKREPGRKNLLREEGQGEARRARREKIA
jgi:hypothetical protein